MSKIDKCDSYPLLKPNGDWPLYSTLPSGEPVLIRRQNRDVAVIMSAEEYERIRDSNATEFERFCDRVAENARARGLTQEILDDLLRD